jgi:hypothetical protein
MPLTKIRANTQIQPLTITDAEVDNFANIKLSKLEDGLKLLKSDGSIPLLGNLDLNNYRILNLATPQQKNDGATKNYVDKITSAKSPTFTYASGVVTRIDYSNGEYRTISYSSGKINQIINYKTNVTITKVFVYDLVGKLQSIQQSEVYV